MQKEFKTYEEQIEILKSRGLIFQNEEHAKKALKEYGYFNIINRYKSPFLSAESKSERFNATFEEVYTLFTIDAALRSQLLPYLVDIERKLKASIAHHFSEQYGNDHTKYISPEHFKEDKRNAYYVRRLIKYLHEDIAIFQRKGHKAICHYLKKYKFIPLWVLMSVLSFGRVASFFKVMKLQEQQKVAKDIGFSVKELSSIVFFLADIRNICAHSDRLYSHSSDAPQFQPIVNLKEHEYLNIPKNDNGEYIYGRFDVLAVFIILKRCTTARKYQRLVEFTVKIMRMLRIAISQRAYTEIVMQSGLNYELLQKLKLSPTLSTNNEPKDGDAL